MHFKKIGTLSLLFIFCLLVINACSKSDGGGGTTDPCAGKTITVNATTTNSNVGASTGSITATAAGSTGFTYSLNGGGFQASGVFNNLAAGNYTVTAKDGSGCAGTGNFTVAENDPCAGKTIVVSGTPAGSDPCTNDGSIAVSATGSTNFTYNLNGGTFQATANFSNLAAGNYTIGARDGAGCVKTNTVTISTKPNGALFAAVKPIIQGNCAISGCHNGTTSPNFTVDCNISSNAAKIKTRAVDQAGTSSQMPQPPAAALSVADRDKITAWVNAGGKVSN